MAFFMIAFLANTLVAFVPAELESLFNYTGELFVVVSLPIALMGLINGSQAAKIVAGLFALFALAEIASGLIFPLPGFPQLQAGVLGLFLDTKIFVGIFAMAYLARVDIETVGAFFRFVLFLLIALVWLNLPFQLRDVVDGSQNLFGDRLLRRVGFALPTGLYWHKAISAQMALFAMIACLVLMETPVSRGARTFLRASLGLCLFEIALSLSAKEAISAALVLVIHYATRNGGLQSSKALFSLTAGSAFMVAAIMIPNPLSTVIQERFDRYTGEVAETRIRNLLYSSAADIAVEHFPLGTGPGTFASEPSRSMGYSPVYQRYGFHRVYGGRPDGEASFLLDGFWAKILAEGGILGFLGFAGAILVLLRRIVVMRRFFPNAQIFTFALYAWIAVLPITVAAGILNAERNVLLLAFSGVALASVGIRTRQNG
jgi:hypothetical protein